MKIYKQKIIKISVIVLEVSSVLLLAYLVLFPFYPMLVYKLKYEGKVEYIPYESGNASTSLEMHKKIVQNNFPEAHYDISPNRLIIPKIGVNAPIVESESEKFGLSQGAWHLPDSSSPDRGGNTVITGHRFKYLPPNNVTFYSFDKLGEGDFVSVIWNKEEYDYYIVETKIVPATEVSILEASNEAKLTLFTCHPIYSTEKRLVVVAEPVKN